MTGLTKLEALTAQVAALTDEVEFWLDAPERLQAIGRAAAANAKAKAVPFDRKVRTILQSIESRRGPIPSRGRASLIASAILRSEGGNVETIRRQVRRSLDRQQLH
jgi:hypothetical protein